MYDRTGMIELIEDAESHTPYCTCGQPMTAATRDGALWLECSARPDPRRGLLSRLVSLDWVVGTTASSCSTATSWPGSFRRLSPGRGEPPSTDEPAGMGQTGFSVVRANPRVPAARRSRTWRSRRPRRHVVEQGEQERVVEMGES